MGCFHRSMAASAGHAPMFWAGLVCCWLIGSHGVAVALRIPNPTTAVRFRLRSSLCRPGLSSVCLPGSRKIPLLPGFEPGLPDSRSGVLTTTLQERRVATSPMAQSVARQAVNLQVAGSNPAGGDVWSPDGTGCGAELRTQDNGGCVWIQFGQNCTAARASLG